MTFYASATEHDRSIKKLPSTSRKRCNCGCDMRATHLGLANDCGMTIGCELSIRRWKRDGYNTRGIG